MLPEIALKELSNGWWLTLSAVAVVLAVSFIVIGVYAYSMRKRDQLVARLSVAQDMIEPKSHHISSGLDSPMMDEFVSRRPSILRHLALYDRIVTDIMDQSHQKAPPPIVLVHSSTLNDDNDVTITAF